MIPVPSHVQKAIDRQIAFPHRRPDMGAQMALIAGTTLAGTTIGAAVPVVGPAVGALFGAAVGIVNEHAEPEKLTPPDLGAAINASVAWRTPICAFYACPRQVKAWNEWLASVWELLVAGGKIRVPDYLDHPREVGFDITKLASNIGQDEDWALPLLDGSRLHAHEYDHGAIVIHRDRIDPSRGAVLATWHWSSETREGQLLAVCLGVGGVIWWLTRSPKPKLSEPESVK